MYRHSIFSPIQRHSYFPKKFSYTKEIGRYKVRLNTFNYSYDYYMIFLRYRKKQFANIFELIDVATDSQWTGKVQSAADPSPIHRYSSVAETQFIRSASVCCIRLCKLERSSIDQYLTFSLSIFGGDGGSGGNGGCGGSEGSGKGRETRATK